MVTTRAQARKNYKEPDTDDDFGTPPTTPKKRRTRKNGSDNVSKKTKSRATEPKDTKYRVTKSKATKSKATKSKATKSKATKSKATKSKATKSKATKSKATKSKAATGKAAKSKATKSKAVESRVTRSQARQPKATEFEDGEPNIRIRRVIRTSTRRSRAAKSKATESKDGEPKATKYRVVKTGTRKSEVPKPSSDRRRSRSPSAVLRGNPDATFSRLPSDVYSLICEQAARPVHKGVPGIPNTSWRTHRYESGIDRVNDRMREIAPRTLLALDRSENAAIWIHFRDILDLPRLLYLIEEAYGLSKVWTRRPSDNRPDWQQAQDSYHVATGSSIEYYLDPNLHAHVYRRLTGSKHFLKLDPSRQTPFRQFPEDMLRVPPRKLAAHELRSLRAFVQRILERMRYPCNTRGELEVRVVLPNALNPEWNVRGWPVAENTTEENRQQLLRLLHLLHRIFSEEIRVHFVIVERDSGRLFNFDFRDTIDEYQEILDSDWWDDESFEVGLWRMTPEDVDAIFDLQADEDQEEEEEQQQQEQPEQQDEEDESLDLLEDLE